MNRTSLSPWALLPALLLAAAAAAGAAPLQATLDNGLRVLVSERPDAQLVTVEVFYAAGSVTEPDSLAGLAHLSEHFLAGDPALSRRQALLVFDRNAFTSPEAMAFRSECLPAFLPAILDLEARRMTGVRPDSSVFARERSVVLSEFAYRTGSREASTQVAAFRTAFPGHPYGRSGLGTPESLARITRDDLAGFMARGIQPAAAALVVEGPVAAAAVLELIRERFAALPAGSPPPPLPAYPPATARQAIFDNRDHVGFRVSAAVRLPRAAPRDQILAELAAEHLQSAFGSADVVLIPSEAVVTYSWYGSYFQPEEHPAAVARGFDPDLDVQSSLGWSWKRIHAAMDALSDPARRQDLEQWLAKAAQRRQQRSLAQTTTGSALLAGATVPTDSEYAALLAEIELSDLQRFLAEHFVTGGTAIAVSHGRDSQRISARGMAGRVDHDPDIAAEDPLADLTAAEIQPVLQAYAEAGLLRLETFALGNGTPVVCRTLPGDDECTLVGWRHFAPGEEAGIGRRPGLCDLYNWTADYLPKAGDRDRPLPPWPHDAEIRLSARGRCDFRAAGPRDQAAEVAATLAERLAGDDFNTRAWAGALDRAESTFARRQRSSGGRSQAWRWARILGAEHPSVLACAPDPAVLDKLKFKDLAKLHRQAARPTGDTTLLTVGGTPAAALREALETGFGRRDAHRRWTPPPPPPGPVGIAGRIFTVTRETDVLLELSFPACLPDDSWPQPGLLLLLLEQTAESALESRLRHREGWSYAVSLRLTPVSGWILPELRITCRPGQAPAVLQVIRDEMAGWSTAGFTPDQLALGRLKLVSRLLRSSDDAQALQAWLDPVSLYGIVPQDPVAAVLAVDPADGGREAAALFPADRFVFTATGAILEEDLEQFGF